MPAGMPLSGLDRFEDLRPCAASIEAAGLEFTESLAVGLRGPLGCCGIARPATTAVYASLPSVGLSCRLQLAVSSPVAGAGQLGGDGSGAGRRAAGSVEASRVAFLFPDMRCLCESSWCFDPAGRDGLAPLFAAMAFRSSWSTGGGSFTEAISFKKANYCSVSIVLTAG